ncbi:MAG TPA: transcriptional regulator [Geobacteraceae bacterium]|nr:transcriptional regulator [Geobacteraceae bacterium]
MRFLLWLLIIYIGYRIVKAWLIPGEKQSSLKTASEEETFQDPVCGLYVSSEDATVGRLEGEKLYFCSVRCLEKYQERLNNK